MSEQNPPETISSLSQALTQFIDYTGQTLRAHDVQLRSQQEQINSLTQLTRQVAESQILLSNQFGQTLDLIEQTQSQIRDIQSDIREIQSEIRGLQTENRRMIEEFIDRRDPPEEPEV